MEDKNRQTRIPQRPKSKPGINSTLRPQTPPIKKGNAPNAKAESAAPKRNINAANVKAAERPKPKPQPKQKPKPQTKPQTKPKKIKKPKRTYTPEQIKARKEKRAKAAKLILTVIGTAAVLAALVFCFIKFFVVKEITVTGSKRYSDEEIIEASQIEYGVNTVFGVKGKNASKNITSKSPYILKAIIKRHLPSKIEIKLEECDAEYYFKLGDEFFITDKALKILEKINVSSEAQISLYGLKEIVPKRIKEAFVGEEITFYDDYYSEYIKEFLSLISECEMYGKITAVNAESKFNIKVKY
ncbi:MAG: FtsQ-type POTRA domain-containing protein, partial [Clostridia bacterium]|nr:FtsQ-type POTRA domain-containing protein [Clostridia bacterium]